MEDQTDTQQPVEEEQQPEPAPQHSRWRGQPSPPEPLAIPSGFFARLDFLLQSPEQIRQCLTEGRESEKLILLFGSIAALNFLVYGAVMGASNLLQGSQNPLWQQFVQIPITGIKLPLLFLLTLAITLPPLYVSNAFSGARLPFKQFLALLLSGLALGSTLLASLATVAAFFALTSTRYDFIKLLHIIFFAYASISVVAYLNAMLQRVSASGLGKAGTPLHLRVAWLVLYIFVGTQLAWVLRPFIAAPDAPFQVFRDRKGSFYESVQHSARLFMSGQGED